MKSQKISLNGAWDFRPEGATAWSRITVPAQWSHGQCWGFPTAWQDVERAWYRRTVAIPAGWAGRRLRLHFGAVMLKAEVFAGREKLGEHGGGFTPFEIDVSRFAGRTIELNVRVSSVRAVMPDDDTYLYPVSYNDQKEEGVIARGIWQPVWLIADPPVRLVQWRHRVSVGRRWASFEVQAANGTERRFRGRLRAALQASGPIAADGRFLESRRFRLAPGESRWVRMGRSIEGLPLWSHEDPRLLRLRFTLEDDAGRAVHALPGRVGLREVRLRGHELLLNGRPVHLLGFSLLRHRISPHLWRRDYLRLYLRSMKRLGFNAMRVHGCIGPPVVFEVADEVGLLVESQSSIWSNPEPRYWAGGETFMANALRETEAWIERDRNHPCVILWDVENEQVRINPREAPRTRRLIDGVRSIDETRPVVASGAGTLAGMDVDHIHCDSRIDRLIDRWRSNGRSKPLIAGEWWADQTRLHLPCLQKPEGLAGRIRCPQGFRSQADVDRGLGELFAEELRIHRLQGLAGSFPFGTEVCLFDPLFPGREDRPYRLDVPADRREPVGFVYAEHHEHTEWVSTRRPYVNPGWDPTRPRRRLNEAFARPLRRALSPVLVGFREPAATASPGRPHRTLVVVNDGPDTLEGPLSLKMDGHEVLRRKVRVPAGGVREYAVRVPVPSDRAGRTVKVTAHWPGRGKSERAEMARWRVYPNRGPSASGTVHVSAADEAVVRRLRTLGCAAHETDSAPAASGLWIIGAGFRPEREAALAFLRKGGRILLLRQEEGPDWLPAVMEFRNSETITGHATRSFGFPALSRAQSGLVRAPVLARSHPALVGLVGGEHVGPWQAADGSVADDHFLKTVNRQGGAFTALIGGSTTDAVCLGELRIGRGRVLTCQLRLEENLEDDPEAAALFDGLVRDLLTPPSAPGDLTVDDPALRRRLCRELEVDLCAPGAASGPEELRVLTDPRAVRDLLRELRDERGGTYESLRRGQRIVCVVGPAAGTRLGEWGVRRLRAEHWISSVVDRPDAMSGWTWSDLQDVPAPVALSEEKGASRWRDGILAFAHEKRSLRAGVELGDRLGSLLKIRRLGRGWVAVTTLDLAATDEPAVIRRWESLASATGAALPVERVPPARPVPRLELRRVPPLAMDGDYWKWAALKTDLELIRRAEPQVLESTENRHMAPGVNRSRYGGLAYGAWNDQALYLAALAVAPAHRFGDSQFNYVYTCMEAYVGPTQIVLSRNSAGQPTFYVHGIPLAGRGTQEIEASVTVHESLPDWPDLGLLSLAEPSSLKGCLLEMALPWRILATAPPEEGGDVRLAVRVGLADPDGDGVVLQLVTPPTFEFLRPPTYTRATLRR